LKGACDLFTNEKFETVHLGFHNYILKNGTQKRLAAKNPETYIYTYLEEIPKHRN